MNTKREVIKERMRKIIDTLIQIRIDIDRENTGGKQFDFVSDPGLADLTDRMINLIDKINKTVYQKI